MGTKKLSAIAFTILFTSFAVFCMEDTQKNTEQINPKKMIELYVILSLCERPPSPPPNIQAELLEHLDRGPESDFLNELKLVPEHTNQNKPEQKET